MPAPIIPLAFMAGKALFGETAGREIEKRLYSPETQKYLYAQEERIVSSGVPYSRELIARQPFYSKEKFPYQKETYFPGQEDVLRAQKAEEEFLARQPELPGPSQISRLIGVGSITSGQAGAAFGGGLLPGEIAFSPRRGAQPYDIGFIGGGSAERQRRAIAQYGVERGLSHEEAVRRAEALAGVGRGGMAGRAVGGLATEGVGNVTAGIAGKNILPGAISLASKSKVGAQFIKSVSGSGVKETVARQAGKSAFASGVGAVGESVAGTGGAWIGSGGRLEDAPYYAGQVPGQIVVGGIAGGLVESPRGGVAALRKFKTSELPKPLQAARKSGFTGGLERGLYGVGGMVDVPEIPGDIYTSALTPRPRSLGFGGTTRAPEVSRSTAQVESMVKAATVQRSGRSFAPAFSLAISESTKPKAPSPSVNRGFVPNISIGFGEPFTPGESQTNKKSSASTNALAESEAIAPGLSNALAQSRAYAPEKAPRVPLPFLGLPAAYGAASMLGRERKKYFNELSLFGRAFGKKPLSAKENKLKIKQFNRKVKVMKKMSRVERGVTLFGRGLGVFNVKKSKR